MSKGINLLNHFSPSRKTDGHRMVNRDTGMCYCPSIKDVTQAHWTSNGLQCSHCNTFIQ
jgi:hypothetical protein